MTQKSYLGLTITMVGLLLTTACFSGGSKQNSWGSPPVKELQWAAVLNFKGESVPLSVVLVTAENYDGQARLIVLSTFGASLGDCWFSSDQFSCRTPVSGAEEPVTKLAGAVKDLLDYSSSFLLTPAQGSKGGVPAEWEAVWETPDELVYKRFKPQSWYLTLKKAEVEP